MKTKKDTIVTEPSEGETVPKKQGKVKPENGGKSDLKPQKNYKKLTIWTIKIILITFILSGFFSYLSEITSRSAPLAVAFMLLILLVVINIIFDAIAVAVTSCDLAPLLSMAARKVKGSKIAIMLVKNAERVSNICGDVIGDICGIISGACTVAIVVKIIENGGYGDSSFWITIALSSIVAALTVGGKGIFKEIAIKNSREMVMFVARILSVFYKNK